MMQNQAEGFTKVADRYGRYLTGKEKAAILMSELGLTGGERLAAFLDTKELHIINKYMKRLGKGYDTLCDLQVLEETKRFGDMKGISRMPQIQASRPAYQQVNQNNPLADAIRSNPDAIAKVLSKWMSEE